MIRNDATRLFATATVAAMLTLGACSGRPTGNVANAPAAPVVDDAALAQAAASADEWLTIGRDYAETRFSPLKQIDADNVAPARPRLVYDTECRCAASKRRRSSRTA